ncbi:MAG: NADPH-dependent glutamate synthase [Muribaculaceae bacterium]|nr:NADPH-dependent glutamate synthase [Muribaculaceae bacterium]
MNHALTDRNAPWREQLRASMTPKERSAIKRVNMPVLSPTERIKNMAEVNLGLTPAQAVVEASRCLDCAVPGCVEGCPVSIDIPSFIKNIQKGDIRGAATVLGYASALPAVCGRVCPQEKQCESKCIYNKLKKAPVAIGYLERYAADTARDSVEEPCPHTTPRLGIKVAVAGSGPAGLSFAGDMIKQGFDVTVFEALHEIGGVLKYGIPEFRLPSHVVDAEIQKLANMGVHFEKDTIIGKTLSHEDLIAEGYKGLFVASGAGLPRFMGIPGENLNGVLSSNEYLTRINLMGAGKTECMTPVEKGRRVLVVGGGNTAMDSVRTARRMGADDAIIAYRRGREEKPARAEEIHHAEEEGVRFLTLHNPIEYIGDANGHVCAVRLQKMRLGESDSSGRRSPEPIEGEILEMEVDMVIVSVGVSPNPLIPDSIDGLEVTHRGTLAVDENLQTSLPFLYAGGDIVRGGATVILAMGDGRRAAASMAPALMAESEP